MSTTRKLWLGLATLLLASFGLLLWVGKVIHQQAPPLPDAVVTSSGQVLYTKADMQRGRQVWQSIGGQQLGSIWGHGALLAPDWSADWLHREATAMLELLARDQDVGSFAALDASQQAALKARILPELRRNTYDPATGTITVSALRAQAMAAVAAHYDSLFSNDPATAKLREAYAMRDNTVGEMEHRRAVTAFFWWTAWAAAAERPGASMSYTQNWPYDPLVGNRPTSTAFMWSIFSVLFMICGIGLLAWYHAVHSSSEAVAQPPARDPLGDLKPTPSMKATAKYFWTVLGLLLAQILLGATTAHYQVEGQQAYGFALANYLPYSLTRTWHTELAVLWIATAWLATGLYIAPAISGYEPKFQRLGVNFLWVCLLVIVVGSFAGQWFAVMDKMGLKYNFWFGHQGWEYTDLGRFWQIFLFIGLMLWLFLVGRALWPAMKRRDETSNIVGLLFLSTVAIGLLYGAGLMWGEHTSHRDGRVLALVGGAPVGGGLLRSVRHRGDQLPVRQARPAAGHQRHGQRAVRHHRVHGRRRAGHPAPPVLHRHHHRRARAGRQLLGAGGGAAGADRPGGLRHLEEAALRAVDGALPLADHVLRGGELLEPGRCRHVRLPGQHADRAVLHAGPEPHRAAWSHRAVRRVRLARHRPDAVLPARHQTGRRTGAKAGCAAASGASTWACR